MNKIRCDIGQTIYKYRKMNRETQDDIGSLIGVSRQMISKIELGETNLSYDKAKILAEHFKISLSELIGETNSQGFYTNEISLYQECTEPAGYGLPGYIERHYLQKQTLKGLDGKPIEKTYRIDNLIAGMSQNDLYVVNITSEKNALKVPAGSKVVVQQIKDEKDIPEFKDPTYVVLEWKVTYQTTGEFPEMDNYLRKHPILNEFITLVTPLENAKRNNKDNAYKYVFVDGREITASLDEIKSMCKGIVKKVIIDF